MDKKERLESIIKHYSGGKPSVFAKHLGVAPSTISSWIARNTFDYDLIFAKCEDISSLWLLTGKGEMLKPTRLVDSASNNIQATEEPQTQYRASKSNKPIVDIETRPRIPLNAMAGALSFALEGGTVNDCEQLPVIRAFPRYDFTILINGQSMEPELHSGDELACLNVKTSTYIQWGRMHVLDTDQGIVVKRMFDNGDSLICRSDNKMFQEYIVPKVSIYNIALVVGMLRRY